MFRNYKKMFGLMKKRKDVIVARFYDDDKNNFKDFDGFPEKKDTEISFQHPPAILYVECIHVNDTTPNSLIFPTIKKPNTFYSTNGLTYIKKYNEKYFQGKQPTLEEKLLVNFLQEQPKKDYFFAFSYPKNGITTEQIENLKRWVVKNRHDYRIVFFDWDKTLTVMEGFFNSKLTEVDNFVCDYAQYIMGGKERFDSLKDMFAFLTTHHVQVYIITRNGTLSYPDEKPTFTKIVQCVYPEFQQDQFIYVQGETTKRKALDRWRPKPWTEDMKEPEIVVTAESETLTPTPTKPLKQPNVVVPAESRPLTRTASLRQAQDSSIVSLLLLVILFL
jgi:hypothetical protein